MVNDPDIVSANILQREDVQILKSQGNAVVAIFVPRAPARLRPVYIGSDPYSGTYFRMGEGDCRARRHEVLAMLQDQAELTQTNESTQPRRTFVRRYFLGLAFSQDRVIIK